MMRKIILYIVIVLAVIYVIVSFTQIEQIINTLRKGYWPFLVVAFLLQLLCLFNNSVTYGALYRLVGLTETRGHLFLMTTGSTFVNMIAPSGIGGMALFIDSGKRRNLPSARVMVVGILYAIYEYASLFCVVLLGLVVLFRRNNLSAGELIGTGLLILSATVLGMLLYLGYHSSEQLGKILAAMTRWVNRWWSKLFHHDFLRPERSYEFANEVGEGIATIRGEKKKLLWPFLFALNNKAILICVLAATFLALDTPFSSGTLVGGFSISQLFYYMSPTPAGVGVVESIFPVTLNALRVPFSKALLITLIYRAITLWFPFVIGFVSFRMLQKKHGS